MQEKDGAIGINNQLLWHIPEDLKLFKSLTLGKDIFMGSNTFKSIVDYTKPGSIVLPGRSITVISRGPTQVQKMIDEFERKDYVNYWTLALLNYVVSKKSSEVIIIGGTQLYSQYVPDKIIATIVEGNFEADSFYPHFDKLDLYEVIEESEWKVNPKDSLRYKFVTYQKVKNV